MPSFLTLILIGSITVSGDLWGAPPTSVTLSNPVSFEAGLPIGDHWIHWSLDSESLLLPIPTTNPSLARIDIPTSSLSVLQGYSEGHWLWNRSIILQKNVAPIGWDYDTYLVRGSSKIFLGKTACAIGEVFPSPTSTTVHATTTYDCCSPCGPNVVQFNLSKCGSEGCLEDTSLVWDTFPKQPLFLPEADGRSFDEFVSALGDPDTSPGDEFRTLAWSATAKPPDYLGLSGVRLNRTLSAQEYPRLTSNPTFRDSCSEQRGTVSPNGKFLACVDKAHNQIIIFEVHAHRETLLEPGALEHIRLKLRRDIFDAPLYKEIGKLLRAKRSPDCAQYYEAFVTLAGKDADTDGLFGLADCAELQGDSADLWVNDRYYRRAFSAFAEFVEHTTAPSLVKVAQRRMQVLLSKIGNDGFVFKDPVPNMPGFSVSLSAMGVLTLRRGKSKVQEVAVSKPLLLPPCEQFVTWDFANSPIRGETGLILNYCSYVDNSKHFGKSLAIISLSRKGIRHLFSSTVPRDLAKSPIIFVLKEDLKGIGIYTGEAGDESIPESGSLYEDEFYSRFLDYRERLLREYTWAPKTKAYQFVE